MSENCIFCKIISGEIPGYTIYEDEEFKAILDKFPGNVGHVLILPKNHVKDIYEIDPQQAGRLFALATKLAVALKDTVGLEGLNVLQNNGTIAGQTVFHFHLHLIPRYGDDGVRIGWTTLSPSDDEFRRLMDGIAKKL